MTVVLALYVAATSVGHLFLLSNDYSKLPEKSPSVEPSQARPESPLFLTALARSPASIGVAVFGVLISLGLMSLGGYHATLLSNGLTTSEDIKGRYKQKNPFYQGSFYAQAKYTLCGPLYPSAFDKYHRYDYFEGFNANNNVDMSQYPYEDDGRSSEFEEDLPNTFIDPFVPGSFTLRKVENHEVDSDEEGENFDSVDAFAQAQANYAQSSMDKSKQRSVKNRGTGKLPGSSNRDTRLSEDEEENTQVHHHSLDMDDTGPLENEKDALLGADRV